MDKNFISKAVYLLCGAMIVIALQSIVAHWPSSNMTPPVSLLSSVILLVLGFTGAFALKFYTLKTVSSEPPE